MNKIWVMSACVALTLLTACAQAPKKQAFNAAAAGHIKTVLVTQQPNQDSYEAAVLAHPGASFGLIGGLIAAADMQSKSNRLTLAIRPDETRLQERFSEHLRQALNAVGYQATVVSVPKDAKEDDLFPAAIKGGAGDAVLTVRLIGAYWAAGPSSDYFPRVLAMVRHHDARSGAVLYQDTFSYGYAMPNSQTIHLASDAQYRFADINALVADPIKTREGLYAGIEAISSQVATDLKRQ